MISLRNPPNNGMQGTRLRLAEGHNEQPSAAIFDSRTLQSSPENGERAGYEGEKRRKGSKLRMVVDTLGNLLALHVTPASEQDRAQVSAMAQQAQGLTRQNVQLAFVDRDYTPDRFVVRNSWGTYWGDKGFAYASLDYTEAAFNTESYGISV